MRMKGSLGWRPVAILVHEKGLFETPDFYEVIEHFGEVLAPTTELLHQQERLFEELPYAGPDNNGLV